MKLNMEDALAMLGAGVMIVVAMECIIWALTGTGVLTR